MKPTPKSLGIAAIIFAAAAMPAQSLDKQNNAPETRPPTESDEVITLDEFQVSAKALKDTYIATEATAGTRTGDKIVDIPLSIQVFTEDFVNDFQLFDDDALLSYVSAATTNTGTSTGIRVRGFSALVTRDGFQYAMPGTPSNTLQTEIIKGPLSTLYGRATPGGIINKISRRPSFNPKYSASATYGTDNFLRFNATGTGPLIQDKLFYFAYAEYQRAEPAHENYIDGNEKFYLGLSFLYKFAKATSLTATIEYQPERTQDSCGGIILLPPTPKGSPIPADVPYVDGDPTKGTRFWRGVDDYSFYGPQNSRECDYYGLNLLFEHRINQTLSFRAAFQTYEKTTDKDRWSGGEQYRYNPSGTYAGANDRKPFRQQQDENNYAAQMDLLAKFETGGVTHRILAAVDSSVYNRNDLQLLGNYTLAGDPDQLAGFAGKRLSIRRAPGQWSDQPVNAGGYGNYNFDNLRTESADIDYDKFTAGALVSYRASMLDEKLALMASGRLDYYDDSFDNPPAAGSPEGSLSDTAFTYSVGANYKIAGEALLIYASVSTGFEPTSTVDLGISQLVPPEDSFGYEAGFKGDFNNGKAGYTISFYVIDLNNVRSNNPDYESAGPGQGVPQFKTNNKNSAKGIDANCFIRPVTNLTLQGALGYTDSTTDKSSDPYALGQPLEYVAKWNGSLTIRYEIPQWHITTGIGLRAQSGYLVDYATATINEVRRAGLFLADCFINYKWKLGKTTHKVALNLNNITDKKYYTNTGRLNYGFEGRLTYTFNY